MTTDQSDSKKPATEAATEKQRQLQQDAETRQQQKQAKSSKPEKDTKQDAKQEAIQDGSRKQPELPFPAQHLDKPGNESQLNPRPQFMAPDYVGSGKLKD